MPSAMTLKFVAVIADHVYKPTLFNEQGQVDQVVNCASEIDIRGAGRQGHLL